MLGLLAEYIMPPTSAPRNPIMRRTRTSFGGDPYETDFGAGTPSPSRQPVHTDFLDDHNRPIATRWLKIGGWQ